MDQKAALKFPQHTVLGHTIALYSQEQNKKEDMKACFFIIFVSMNVRMYDTEASKS